MGFGTPEEGYLAKIIIPPGTENVNIGTPVCIIGSDEGSVGAFKDSGALSKHRVAPVRTPTAPAAAPAASAPAAAPKALAALPSIATSSGERVFASPLAKRLAAEQGLGLQGLAGSGLFASITSKDLAGASPAGATARSSAVGGFPGGQDIPGPSIRGIIAKRLLESKKTIPHYYLTVDVRMDAALARREQFNKILEKEKVKLSVNDSAWVGDVIRQYDHIDVSVAVSTGNGLITPIVFADDAEGIVEISKEVKALAPKAREGKLQPQAFQGGNITVWNLGMFGIKNFSAISIHHNRLYSLSARPRPDSFRPTMRKDSTAEYMSATASCDHRTVNGAVGAQGLTAFKSLLENPTTMLLYDACLNYLVCKKNSSGCCNGRGILENGTFTQTQDHVCGDPDPLLQPLHEFRIALKESMAESRISARKVYDLVSQRHEIAAMHLPFIDVQRNMNRWKENNMPQVTGNRTFNSFEEFHECLSSPQMLERLKYPGGQITCQLIECRERKSLAFLDENFVELFVGATKLSVDGTFKVTPRIGGQRSRRNQGLGYQVLVVVAEVSNCNFPIMWVIMPEKSEAAYTSVFKVVLKQFRCFQGVVMTDFEIGLRNALRVTMPEATIVGCLFHYAQALYKRARKHGILRAIRNNDDGKKFLRKIVALALLPCHLVQEAFELIRDLASDELKTIFKDFLIYYEDYWLKQRGPDEFSVYRQQSRTNNVSESHNACLSRKMQKGPSGITFAMEIVEIQKRSYREFKSLETTGKPVSRRKTKYIIKNGQLNRAWTDLDDGVIEIPSFLVRAASIVQKYPKTVSDNDDELEGEDNDDGPEGEANDDEPEGEARDDQPEATSPTVLVENIDDQGNVNDVHDNSPSEVKGIDSINRFETNDIGEHYREPLIDFPRSNFIREELTVKPGTQLATRVLMVKESLKDKLNGSRLNILVRDSNYPTSEHSYAALSRNIDVESTVGVNIDLEMDNVESQPNSSTIIPEKTETTDIMKPILHENLNTSGRKIVRMVTTSVPNVVSVCKLKSSAKRCLEDGGTHADFTVPVTVEVQNKIKKREPVPKNLLKPRWANNVVTLPILPSSIAKTSSISVRKNKATGTIICERI